MSGSDEAKKQSGDSRKQDAPKVQPQTNTPEEQKAVSPDETAPSDGNRQSSGSDADRISALEAEVENLRDQVLRARAEVENVLRRTAREKQDASAYAISGFARDLLSVSDNLRRALDALPEEARADSKVKAFFEGVEMTERELLNSFERHGIRKIDPRGEKFDHNFHQAMAEVDADGQAPGTVVDVYQAGYVIRDRLLRPAMVTVARKSADKPAENADRSA